MPAPLEPDVEKVFRSFCEDAHRDRVLGRDSFTCVVGNFLVDFERDKDGRSLHIWYKPEGIDVDIRVPLKFCRVEKNDKNDKVIACELPDGRELRIGYAPDLGFMVWGDAHVELTEYI